MSGGRGRGAAKIYEHHWLYCFDGRVSNMFDVYSVQWSAKGKYMPLYVISSGTPTWLPPDGWKRLGWSGYILKLQAQFLGNQFLKWTYFCVWLKLFMMTNVREFWRGPEVDISLKCDQLKGPSNCTLSTSAVCAVLKKPWWISETE